MANETGHARNVERFQQLISFVAGYGATYNPSNANIALAGLQTKLTEAQAGIDAVTTNLAPSKAAINARQTTFEPLRPLTTKVVNFYASTGTAENNLDDVKTFARKIQGKRKSDAIEDDPNTPEDESAASHSASQQSYTQLVEHLDNMIGVLSGDALYAPNETELTLVELEKLSTDMKDANQAVIDTFVPLDNARNTRDDALYKDGTGLFDLAKMVKKYVKAVYGSDSNEYEQIKGLEFKRVE